MLLLLHNQYSNHVQYSFIDFLTPHCKGLISSSLAQQLYLYNAKRVFDMVKSGLTLHDLCRTTDQIGCDMSRRVIVEDRGKWLWYPLIV